ncbi:NAD(P)H-binding protein [Chitinophaga qingshengii]|uniref:NAD(P)H-binding protein n=1 Tax=Chitinophaga qingshengii TaxID=1569794 RepID=A0ABR7TF28_9BACT|nr:NAD(P)H-binding protein [Chitinophaga qingshengii]MBC9928906.1 NAD(P)H-binding protein [Chitinophaga qingshengii]
MKIIVTGSLGNISRPLTQQLTGAGHQVTVISSNPEKQSDVEALGATAAIGSLEDTAFIEKTFTGADAVYCMTPPNYVTAETPVQYYSRIADTYAQAIRHAGVQRVVYLSSFGAPLTSGTGIILGSHHGEAILDAIPGLTLTHIRPGSFYTNLYHFTDMIRHTGKIALNYGGDDLVPWVSAQDIAGAVAEELVRTGEAPKTRYVSSDERTCNEVAAVLGKAIGRPGLQWQVIPATAVREQLDARGVPAVTAAALVELYDSIHSGVLLEDYRQHPPASMGKVKMEVFAREFAAVFAKSN